MDIPKKKFKGSLKTGERSRGGEGGGGVVVGRNGGWRVLHEVATAGRWHCGRKGPTRSPTSVSSSNIAFLHVSHAGRAQGRASAAQVYAFSFASNLAYTIRLHTANEYGRIMHEFDPSSLTYSSTETLRHTAEALRHTIETLRTSLTPGLSLTLSSLSIILL